MNIFNGRNPHFFSMIAGIFGIFVIISQGYAENKLIIGWVEKIVLLPHNIEVHAKIDTGADNSSLNVQDIKEFLQAGERWVQFTFHSKEGKTYQVKKPLYRMTQVKRKGTAPQERPVVLFDLCLGNLTKKDVEVNLTDRSGFKYNMLVGRSFLGGLALVDGEKTYTQALDCSLD